MDSRTFDGIYLEYRDALWRFAYGFLKSAPAAEDTVQDVFVSLWERREDIKIEHSIKVWLYAAVRNRALNALRHDDVVNNINIDTDTENAPGHSAQYQESALDALERSELKKLIDQTVESMPPRRRAMFELRHRDDLTLSEVAQVFGVSTAAAHKAVVAAEEALRPVLERYYKLG